MILLCYYLIKSITFCLLVILVVPVSAQLTTQRNNSSGRGGEIGGFVGYQMLGRSGQVNIIDDWNFGFTLNIPVRPGIRGELSYTRQNSSLKSDIPLRGDTKLFDMSVEYFHIGGLAERPMPGSPATPFALFSLGATRFAPKDSNFDDEWRFSIAAGLGVKVNASERIGLRLQARALMPLQFSGGGIFCGTGGCSAGLGAGIQMFQIDTSAGLYVNF
jgi:opacity protein-like surface antigen